MFWLILQCLGGLCLGLMFWLGPKQGCSAFALLIAGAAAPSVLFLSYLALEGALGWFWLFYIRVNYEHVSVPLAEYLSKLPDFIVIFTDMDLFMVPGCTIIVFALFSLFSLTGSRDGKGLITRRGFAAAALLVVFLLGSFFAATRTMSTYDHYINIMVPSFAILTALGLTLWRDEKLRGNCAFAMLAALTGVFCLKMVTIDKVQPIQALQQHEIIDEDVYPFSDVIHYLNSHVRPGEPVAVWGWETGFPIYATMPSATASHSSTSGSSTDCCATSLYATPTRASGWLLCSSTMTWRATRSAP